MIEKMRGKVQVYVRRGRQVPPLRQCTSTTTESSAAILYLVYIVYVRFTPQL